MGATEWRRWTALIHRLLKRGWYVPLWATCSRSHPYAEAEPVLGLWSPDSQPGSLSLYEMHSPHFDVSGMSGTPDTSECGSYFPMRRAECPRCPSNTRYDPTAETPASPWRTTHAALSASRRLRTQQPPPTTNPHSPPTKCPWALSLLIVLLHPSHVPSSFFSKCLSPHIYSCMNRITHLNQPPLAVKDLDRYGPTETWGKTDENHRSNFMFSSSYI